MKKSFWQGLVCLGLFVLTSCAYHAQSYDNLTQENWPEQIHATKDQWLEQYNSTYNEHLFATPLAPLADFNRIHVDGNFDLQIVGSQQYNSIAILNENPNIARQQVGVKVQNNTLYIYPAGNVTTYNPNKIILRIGLYDLQSLVESGTGNVVGKKIDSDVLSITSTNRSHILLIGKMNLTDVTQSGSGVVSVIGAQSPSLTINVMGSGNVNVSGQVGIHSIKNYGGNINILGAQSSRLTIQASGGGMTAISGNVNLNTITALDNSRVYISRITSNHASVSVQDRARVGLAGTTQQLNIDASESARFEGRSLYGKIIFVSTKNEAHANVNPIQKLFATASNNSSIYFYHSPVDLDISQFKHEEGNILPVQ